MALKIQVLIMTNEVKCTLLTVKNLKELTENILVYYNGKEDSNTLKDQNIQVVNGDFVGFDKTRNKVLEMRDKQADFVLFLDDTYEIEAPLKFKNELQKYKGIKGLGIVKVISKDGVCHNRKIIVPKGVKARYIYPVHELLVSTCKDDFIIQTPVNDVHYEEHNLRTYKRSDYDLKCLKKMSESCRKNYYIGISYMKMKDYDNMKYYFEKVKVNDLRALGLVIIGLECKNERLFLEAAKIYKPIATECYYRYYMVTKDIDYLIKAHQGCMQAPITNMPIDQKLYGEDGVISSLFKKIT